MVSDSHPVHLSWALTEKGDCRGPEGTQRSRPEAELQGSSSSLGEGALPGKQSHWWGFSCLLKELLFFSGNVI